MQVNFHEDSKKLHGDYEVVETTSLAAAKAMAKYYLEQGESGLQAWEHGASVDNNNFISQRVEDGKTVYSIRPRPRSRNSLDQAGHSLGSKGRSHVNMKLPFTSTTSPHPKKKASGVRETSLRQARSNPQLRTMPTRTVFADEHGFYRSNVADVKSDSSSEVSSPLHYLTLPRGAQSHHILTAATEMKSTPASALMLGSKRSRSSSIPRLAGASADNLHARGVLPLPAGGPGAYPGAATQDVLGHILGWSDSHLRSKASSATLRSHATSAKRSQPPAPRRLKHLSTVSSSSSADAGDEASQAGSTNNSKRQVEDSMLPSDLQEEIVEEPSALSPSGSPGPSTPTLTLSEARSLSQFPSNESNTVKFQPPTKVLKGSKGPKESKTGSQPASVGAAAPTFSPEAVQPTQSHSPFGAGVKLRNEGLKRVKPSPSSETASAFETSFADPTQEAEAVSKPRFQDPTIFDVLQALESHSSTLKYQDTTPISAAISRDSIAGSVASVASSPHLPRHGRSGSTSSLVSESSQSSSFRLSAQQITVSAAATDDPRFIIWGTTNRPGEASAKDSRSQEQGSPIVSHSPSSSMGTRRWSRKASVSSHELPSSGKQSSPALSSSTGPSHKILMAATIERWIAEMTTKIDPDLLADFFLTYRSFLSPHALCQLLITRFNWALAEPQTPEDEASRRIVRVRTFVVIRHWLLNYFVEDFVPDPQLRGMLTEWLNTTAKLQHVKASPSDQRLIKNLKRVVRKLKDQYASIGSALEHGAAQLEAALGPLGLGLHASRSPSPMGPAIVLDEDVDLDIDTYQTGTGSFRHRATAGHRGTEGLLLPVSPPKPPRTSRDGDSFDLPRERASSGKLTKSPPGQNSPSRAPHSSNASAPHLPMTHGPVSRAVTSTLGQFGRFKRMIQSRSSHSSTDPTGMHVDDGETDVFSSDASGPDVFSDPTSARRGSSTSPSSFSYADPPSDDPDTTIEDVFNAEAPARDTLNPRNASQGDNEKELRHSVSAQTIKSDLRSSVGPVVGQNAEKKSPLRSPLTQATFNPPYRASVVQLDDVGLSDDDSEDEIELPRTLRRLPAARDLRHAEALRQLAPRFSNATMSSIGTARSSKDFARKPSFVSFRSKASRKSESSNEEAGPGVISNFVIDGLDSDEEESGDVEAALRRLEGHIDSSRQEQKARRVEQQMAKSKAAASGSESNPGNSTDSAERKPEDTLDETPEEREPPEENDSDKGSRSSLASAKVAIEPPAEPRESRLSSSSHYRNSAPQSVETTLPGSEQRKSRLSVIRQSMTRKSSVRNIWGRGQTQAPRPAGKLCLSPGPPMAPSQRSFVLMCKTEVLARQFCLIERDILSNISWHELVQGIWRDRDTQLDVLDWEQFLKSRARQLVQARERGEQLDSTEIHAAIARFNLVANWCPSEILLCAHLDERAALIGKFIRLAWKCYRQSNFQTLTQIIFGLQSVYVERLTKTWARVGMWEMRVFRDLKAFTSHARNFRALRQATDALADEWGPPGSSAQSSGATDGKGLAGSAHLRSSKNQVTGCLPFLGLFLRDLAISNELPAFLDATSPTTPASIDPVSQQLDAVADTQAFEDLPTIPQHYQLYPLINVHKARTISSIVQKVLAFQEMASCYPYEAEPVLFRRCLALRCLSLEEQCQHSFQLE